MSSNLSKLKFMAKARELRDVSASKQPQAATESARVSALDEARWVLVPEVGEPPAVSEKDGKFPAFRRSFGGFNTVVETRVKHAY